MSLQTEHFERCVATLRASLERLTTAEPGGIDREVFRNAAVKGFELAPETAGKLLRKALKEFAGDPGQVDSLGYKDVFRHAVRHGLVDADLAERWFAYRDARNATAHDCGEALAQETVAMLAGFVDDATALHRILREKLPRGDA